MTVIATAAFVLTDGEDVAGLENGGAAGVLNLAKTAAFTQKVFHGGGEGGATGSVTGFFQDGGDEAAAVGDVGSAGASVLVSLGGVFVLFRGVAVRPGELYCDTFDRTAIGGLWLFLLLLALALGLGAGGGVVVVSDAVCGVKSAGVVGGSSGGLRGSGRLGRGRRLARGGRFARGRGLGRGGRLRGGGRLGGSRGLFGLGGTFACDFVIIRDAAVSQADVFIEAGARDSQSCRSGWRRSDRDY